MVVALAWLLGMAAAALWQAPAWLAGAWLAAFVPATWRRRGRGSAAVLLIAAVVAVVGAWRFDGWQDRDPPDLARWVGSEATVEGMVASEPDPGLTTTSYEVAIERVLVDGRWEAAGGRLRVTLSQFAEHEEGERLQLAGEVREAPVFADFDYRGYLLRRGVVGTMLFPRVEVVAGAPRWSAQRLLTVVRLRLEAALQRALPEPEASLAAGIAFGRDGNLPDGLYTDFRDAGVAHIVAVSGTNITIVAAVAFMAATAVVGRRRALLPVAVIVFAYVVVAGLSPSVLRAGVMAGVYLLGTGLGRQQGSLAALGVAAVAMTALSPEAAADLGFQLSLTATAGLVVFGPWVTWAIGRGVSAARLGAWSPEWAVRVAGITLSATVATLPVVWVNLGRVSLVGPFANVVVEPVFVVAFALSGLAALMGTAWAPAGWLVGLGAYYPLAFMGWFTARAAALPYAAVDVPARGGEWAFAAYLVLVAGGWPAYRYFVPSTGRRPTRVRPTARRMAAAAGAAGVAVAVVVTSLLPTGGPGELRVAVLNVGQGDAILVTTPHGHQVLVDGGPSGIVLARELGATMPHWDRSIDVVFLTHPQQDHVGGLPELFQRFDIGTTYDTGIARASEGYAAYAGGRAGHEVIARGGVVTIDGVTIEVLWPPDAYATSDVNNTSLILRVTYGETSVLLTGDAEAPAQRALMALEDVQADVLKVPHHGSKTSAPEFLRAVGAEVAVVSVGEGNQFGHPAEATLAALSGTVLLRTDQDGRVTVTSDGRHIRVTTQR